MDFGSLYLISVFNVIKNSLLSVPTAAWYVVPPFFIYASWNQWIGYARQFFIKHLDWALLEVKIPREVTKTPAAMEILLHIFHQTKDGTFIERWWQGFVRPWFSLEIASFGGDVHFYIRTQRSFKNAVEAQIYSQYPQAEIAEADDYTLSVPYAKGASDLDLWATTFKLDKADHFPIKTYVDYGLDKPVKEEEKIDPITPTLELMGSIGPSEQIWLQILIQASKKRFPKKDSWYKKSDWKDNAKGELDKLQKRDVKTKEGEFNFAKYTQDPAEKMISDAIARSLTKIGFDCGYRTVYIAPTKTFNKNIIPGIIGVTKHYNSPNLNGLTLDARVGFDYPWEDITGKRLKEIKWKFFDAYRKRSYFYDPYKRKPFVFTTEELATIYHFPGQVAATPTLDRIESKRAEPPVNLPV